MNLSQEACTSRHSNSFCNERIGLTLLLRSLSIECLCARLKWGVFFVALCVAEYDRRVVIKGRSGARDDGLYTKKNRCKTKVLRRLSAFEDFSDAYSEVILKSSCGETCTVTSTVRSMRTNMLPAISTMTGKAHPTSSMTTAILLIWGIASGLWQHCTA